MIHMDAPLILSEFKHEIHRQTQVKETEDCAVLVGLRNPDHGLTHSRTHAL